MACIRSNNTLLCLRKKCSSCTQTHGLKYNFSKWYPPTNLQSVWMKNDDWLQVHLYFLINIQFLVTLQLCAGLHHAEKIVQYLIQNNPVAKWNALLMLKPLKGKAFFVNGKTRAFSIFLFSMLYLMLTASVCFLFLFPLPLLFLWLRLADCLTAWQARKLAWWCF